MSAPLRILHICNDFSWTLVHKNLYMKLDDRGVIQTIFVPLRHSNHVTNNVFNFNTSASSIIHSRLLSTYHRLFFGLKKGHLLRDVERTVNLEQIDIVHATTLFSDGAIALELHKRYKKPFIVAVRNTDINFFLKYRPYLFSLANEILENASKIVFISDSSKESFSKHWLIKPRWSEHVTKAIVICNGIDPFWLENLSRKPDVSNMNVLFVGRFDKNKNVLRLIHAAEQLRKRHPTLNLTLVGGTGDQHSAVLSQLQSKKWVKYVGPVFDKVELKSIFAQHSIFAMISHRETFGLVYIEALSQGLPVLYSKGQGIDGVFAQEVGEAVDSFSSEDIQRGLEDIITKYNYYPIDDLDLSRFNWRIIADIYQSIYEQALDEKTSL